MSWDAIGALGEIAGALAVILSLVYLARQIRHGTASVIAANHEALSSAIRALRHAIAADPDLAALVMRGETNPESLCEIDARRFGELVVSQFETWEQAYVNRAQGAIDEAAWEGWDNFGRSALSTPGHRATFRRRRGEFYPPFADYVEREVFGDGG